MCDLEVGRPDEEGLSRYKRVGVGFESVEQIPRSLNEGVLRRILEE